MPALLLGSFPLLNAKEAKEGAKVSKSNYRGYNTNKIFVGGEVGFGGFGAVSVGVVGGYQHYFKEGWQFAGFRHGVRGYGTIDWAQYSRKGFDTSSAMFFQAGADWTLEFNPGQKINWGVFAGLSLGFVSVFSHLNSFAVSGNLGGSMLINNTHRLELTLGSGFSIAGFRYLYMF